MTDTCNHPARYTGELTGRCYLCENADLRMEVGRLTDELARMYERLAELEHMEQTAATLMTRLATMGAVIAHDDAARILRDALEKK